MKIEILSVFVIFVFMESGQSSVAQIRAALQTPLTPSEEYTHKLLADEDDSSLYRAYWKLIDNEKSIQFELHCKTTGWLGFGISPNGGMAGADIVISWVDAKGVGHIRDTYATQKSTPLSDDKQDWTLLESKEVNGYTMIKMSRPLNTCDVKQDLEIKKETNYLIFAWNPSDPATGNNDWMYHDVNKRTRVVMLLDFQLDEQTNANVEANEDKKNAFKFDMILNDLPILSKDTFYFCQFYKQPVYDSDVHLIGYEISISKENRDLVHHILVHECNEDVVKNWNGSECGYAPIKPDVGQCLSSTIVIAWGIGGGRSLNFPNNTGYPLFKSGTKKVFLLEYHFDNPKLSSTRRDSSGVHLFYSKKLRPIELGILTLRSEQLKVDLMIPPRVENFKLSSICYPECTNKYVPDNGINIFSGFLHTHLAGRAVNTKLVRDNKVIANLFRNPRYDFNYQYNIEIEPTKIYRNDSLILECDYSTMDRTSPTYWGFASQDEMCMNFMYYYPRVPDFDFCFSRPQDQIRYKVYESIVKDLNIKTDIEFNLTALILGGDYFENQEKIANLFKNDVNMTDEVKRRLINLFEEPNAQYSGCGGPVNGLTVNYDNPYLKAEPLKETQEDPCTTKKPENGSKSVYTSSSISLMSVLFYVNRLFF